MLAPISIVTWGFWIEPGRLVTRHVPLSLPHWRTDLRVGVLSDLHIGSRRVDLDQLNRIVERTNAQKPDLVVILGDFVIGGPRARGTTEDEGFVEPERIGAGLKNLKARMGVYAVLGNHDWWFNGDRVGKALTDAGLRVLENEAVRLGTPAEGFWLGGIADMWTRNPDIEGTLSQTTPDEPVILFTHNPDIFPGVPDRVSLTIGAHTHGGQVNFPIFGRPITTSKLGYVAGHMVERGRNIFITTGIGTSIMGVRFGVPPEIVILNLTPADGARTP